MNEKINIVTRNYKTYIKFITNILIHSGQTIICYLNHLGPTLGTKINSCDLTPQAVSTTKLFAHSLKFYTPDL